MKREKRFLPLCILLAMLFFLCAAYLVPHSFIIQCISDTSYLLPVRVYISMSCDLAMEWNTAALVPYDVDRWFHATCHKINSLNIPIEIIVVTMSNPADADSPAAAPKKSPKPRYGPAQAIFIERTRKAIKQDTCFFHDKDWSHIKCSDNGHCPSLTAKGHINADSYYVKDVAAWVPHMILRNYIPSCGKCRKKERVDPTCFRFVEHPKILYGVFAHRCLDTVHYYCGACGAWHETTMFHDSDEINGILNFRLSRGFAVDDKLYSFLVSHGNYTTASIHMRIRQMHADKWLNAAAYCYCSVMAGRVKVKNNILEGTHQSSLDSVLKPVEKETRCMKRCKAV